MDDFLCWPISFNADLYSPLCAPNFCLISRSCFRDVTAGTGCDVITLSISSVILLAISFVGSFSFTFRWTSLFLSLLHLLLLVVVWSMCCLVTRCPNSAVCDDPLAVVLCDHEHPPSFHCSCWLVVLVLMKSFSHCCHLLLHSTTTASLFQSKVIHDHNA